ncbi:MMPL family transporter [Tautonia plasticadhaerens]|uniref:Membrane transport protein mmpL8 n=1 Tax=Tautonia plasticadhaerens TaxID=2527974 RepID=A0A518HC12_9BACT|nr:MMPL family transporter [Tautonia plasticadhaerens]QDV38398.1 Membrane transport protein mmpL8 [Tautonia plasticadhaerens]
MIFDLIARLVTRRGWLVVLAWVGLAVLFGRYAPSWDEVSLDDDVRFFPEGSISVAGQALLERGFPESTDSSIVVVAERPDGPLSEADRAFVGLLADRLGGLIGPEFAIATVTDFRDRYMDTILIGGSGEGGSGQAALTLVGVEATYASKQARLTTNAVEGVLAELEGRVPTGLELGLTGSAVVGHDMNESSNASIDTTTYATVALVIAILLAVYRSPLLALIPLVSIALSAFVSLKGLPALRWVPGLDFQVINVTKVFVIVVLFGAGTDYCLFLIARYREERAHGHAIPEALAIAIRQVGAALVASAGTVIVGLGMLWFSSFAKIQFSGPAIALSLAVALVAALTLAPVLLRWFGRAIDWPFGGPRPVPVDPSAHAGSNGHSSTAPDQAEAALRGPWGRVADLVARRPATILAVSLLAMAPFALHGTRVRSNYGQLSDLPADAPSKLGAAMIRDYFPIGELGPTTLLLWSPALDFRTEEGREAIASLSDRLTEMPQVARVRSLARPLGEPLERTIRLSDEEQALPGFLRRPLEQARNALIDQGYLAAEPVYVSTEPADPADLGRITRLDLLLTLDPFSEDGMDALEAIRREVAAVVDPGDGAVGPLAGSEVGYAGSTPMLYDLRSSIGVDERRMYVLVTLGVYAILVFLLKRPGISLYLIATVVLGYLATLGLTDLVFRSLHAGPEPWQGLDWKVGFFLFVILVAVGEDYNIFLMSRVVEEERGHGVIDGTRRAVAATGGIISSCGLIMAGTFGSMLTGRLLALRELGFALAFGVLLDTFLVRPILVPAFIVLLERLRGGRGGARPAPAVLREEAAPGPVSAVIRVDYGIASRGASRP